MRDPFEMDDWITTIEDGKKTKAGVLINLEDWTEIKEILRTAAESYSAAQDL